MIDKLVEIGIMFDFYGKLLSRRQYMAIELYYIHDLSLTEIGQELNISRQSVFDTLKRAEENLYRYEKVLGLIDRFKSNKNDISKLYELVELIEKESEKAYNKTIVSLIKDMKSMMRKMLDDIGGVH